MPDIDSNLWERVKSGNKDAFEDLYRRYYPVLCLFSRRFTGSMDSSREVVQELFIYLWEHRAEMVIKHSLKSYLLGATRYNSIRRAEKNRRFEMLPDFEIEPENATFHDHLELAELQGKILEAISRLPDQCKKVFYLSRDKNLKYSEIAQKLGISVKTVEAHISKALRLIQHHLGNHLISIILFLNLISF